MEADGRVRAFDREAPMQHRLLAVLSLLILTACNTSHSGDDDDASITFDLDGARFDSGVDAPPPDLVIGDACSTAADCGEGGQCIADPDFFPGGYCTQACSEDLACPEGASCLNLGGGQQFCALDCDPEADGRACTREGYGCATNFMVFPTPVCVAGCYDDSDCAEGLQCDPTGGFTGAGTCFDPGSMPGDPCTDGGECPMGGDCLTEAGNGWPGGACIVGCDFATNAGCEGGACIAATFGGGLCVSTCTTDADCRDDYACRPVSGVTGRMYCAPACGDDSACADAGNVCNTGLGTCDVPFDAGQLGDTCRRSGMGCEGGTCLSEGTNGFPGAYCIYAGCTLGTEPGDRGDCPGDGVCVPGTGSVNLCYDGCDTVEDCRPGYACRPGDAADPESAHACVPACVASTDCANADRGFVCNPGTGRCTEPFVAASQGEPCASDDECQGGRCHDEATDGWPAGACVAIGCRLSGTGPESACTAGNTCVDDAIGDPEIGECLPTCTVGASGDCRPGYACAADTKATEGVCRPACEATSCGSGRSCDADTGLCLAE